MIWYDNIIQHKKLKDLEQINRKKLGSKKTDFLTVTHRNQKDMKI